MSANAMNTRTTQVNRKKHLRGQALVEMSLMAPVLLLVVLAIIDYGRILFVYASTSNAVREAARTAQVVGSNPGDPTYANCALIENRARSFVRFANITSVEINYYDPDDYSPPVDWATYPVDYDCTPANGVPDAHDGSTANSTFVDETTNRAFMMRVEMVAEIEFITPFLSSLFPTLQMDFAAMRTVLPQHQLPITSSDQDGDGLLDVWEMRWFGCENPSPPPAHIPPDPGTEGLPLPPANPHVTYGGGYPGSCATDVNGDPIPALTVTDAIDDPDGDGCTNGCEEARGTNPLAGPGADTDGDGLTDGDEIFTYLTDPLNPDTDGDGINDWQEVFHRVDCGSGEVAYHDPSYDSDPNSADTDGDGMTDFEELCIQPPSLWGSFSTPTDPALDDTDGDSLLDRDELVGSSFNSVINGQVTPIDWKTDPTLADTDGDALPDDEEINIHQTDPNDADTDGDGLDDNEVAAYSTDPRERDTDSDGLTDGDEVLTHGTDPNEENSDAAPAMEEGVIPGTNPPISCDLDDGDEIALNTDPLALDTETDGLSDCKEILVWSTDPNNSDTDGDGYTDGDEDILGCHPNNPSITPPGPSIPCTNSDGDQLPDEWEDDYYLPVTMFDESDDPDGDGCNNFCEFAQGTIPYDPTNPPNLTDFDLDGLDDGEEFHTYPTDATLPDTDGDGLEDEDEVRPGVTGVHPFGATNPLNPDTDGDLLEDGLEIFSQPLPFAPFTPHSFGQTDPNNIDSDADSLTDYAELVEDPARAIAEGVPAYNYQTNPNDDDTDGDSLLDNAEIELHGTDPRTDDTDGDDVHDNHELIDAGTDPLDTDTDGDGLLDGEEYYNPGLNPDYDGIPGYSIVFCVTPPAVIYDLTTLNPLLPDTDGDGLTDGDEVNVHNTHPDDVDTDGDQVGADGDDYDEAITPHGTWTDPICGIAVDPNDRDGDGIPNTDETSIYGTDPDDPDSDGDQIGDKPEAIDGYTISVTYTDVNGNPQSYNGDISPTGGPGPSNTPSDPLDDDIDDDGLTDGDEWLFQGTHPGEYDTDGDFISDGDELYYGTNPLDGQDVRQRYYRLSFDVKPFMEEFWKNGETAGLSAAVSRGFLVDANNRVLIIVQPTGGNMGAIQTVIQGGGGLIDSVIWGNSAYQAYVSLDLLTQLMLDTRVNWIQKP